MQRTLLLCLLLLAGCSASPSPQLFTLGTSPGPSLPTRAGGIELRRIGLAGYLDRDSIVLSAANYRLQLATDQRWAEPLGHMLDRILAEDLAQRLPHTPVFTESGAIGGNANLILEINIQRLDADADGTIVLLAQLALRRDGSKSPPRTQTLHLAKHPNAPGTEATIATMSHLLGQLADHVAEMVGEK